MSTGVETWNQNLLDIGPMYPFPGFEGLLAFLGIASWILWHVIQMRMEMRVHEEEEQEFSDPEVLLGAIKTSMAGTLIEQRKAHKDEGLFHHNPGAGS
jgi:hypothetical protein